MYIIFNICILYMYMYIAMYFMYIVDTCKILIFMLNTCIYIYICIFFIHISNRNTSRDHGCLGALLSFQLQLSALDSHCQKGCRCWRFFAGNYRIPEDDSRSCYCIYIYIYISGPALLVSVACFLPGMFSACRLNHGPSKASERSETNKE